jgi:hypothetical protein
MHKKITSLKLNKKDKKIYTLANFFVLSIIIVAFIFIIIKIIFPAQTFTYSFINTSSLRNTLTDINFSNNQLNFYASTNLKFSHLIITLTLTDEVAKHLPPVSVQKSYKAIFYPEANPLENLEDKEENSLVSIDNSVFIIGNNKKTPIDSILTFEGLGYNWDNVKTSTLDLSYYEKQKLASLDAAHPTGTILKITETPIYYFIENITKRKIINPKIENIKNPIFVNKASLDKKIDCTLKNNFLFNNKHTCTLPLSEINLLYGKDYRLTMSNLPAEIQIKKIDLEFKKSINFENFRFFLGELKKRILYRFNIETE